MLSSNAIEKKINIGKRGFSISIPQSIREINGWKLYTRFSYTADPEKHKLVLTESGENTDHQLALHFASMIKVGCNMCSLAGWKKGDTITITFQGDKITMRRTRVAEKKPLEKKPQQEKVNHIHNNGMFPLRPDRVVCKNNRWLVGTRFSCATEDGKIILQESDDGERKISEITGMISITKTTCQRAGLNKCDPIIVEYEDKKIIIARA